MNSLVSKLALGASQFRFEGAASHPRARSPQAEVAEIIAVAARSGVSTLDAAVSFDSGEAIIGAAPNLHSFKLLVRAARADKGPDHVEAEARASLKRLGVTRAEAIIVQNAGELFGRGGPDLWDKLLDLKDQGLFEKIGVVALASDDPLGIAKRFHPDIIQSPASLLDQRLLANGTLAAVAELGVEVHLRSIFLQGLLFLENPPERLAFAAPMMKAARTRIAAAGITPMAAALAFVLSRPEVDLAVIGLTGLRQLEETLTAIATPAPELDWASFALSDTRVLTPSLW